MRLQFFVVSCVLVLGGALPGLAQQQQQVGPRTLEGLLNFGETQEPATAAEAELTDAGPKPPAGTVARPKDGVQHPDLDKAWADYDAAVLKVTELIKAAISKQFDAAATKGDLDAAEKWQVIGKKFEADGELPSEEETKATVSAAVVEYKQAREKLTKAYEDVVKALTIEKRIADARAARAELPGDGPEKPLMVVIEAKNYKAASPNAAPQRDGTGVAIREAARWDNLTIPADSTLLWDVALPQQGNFFVHVLYASGEARPCDVVINGKSVARNVLGGNTGGFMRRHLKWETLGPVAFGLNNQLSIDPQIQSPHLSRIVISSGRDSPQPEEDKLMGSWAAGPDDPYIRVVEPQGRVRELDRRTGKETAAGALRRLDDGRYEAVMSNGFTVYWRLLASDRAEFHAMDRAGKMQDKVVLKKQ